MVDEFGEDFDKTNNGFIDFLLLDDKGFPLIVLVAKSENKVDDAAMAMLYPIIEAEVKKLIAAKIAELKAE